jgi:hypothetical protein
MYREAAERQADIVVNPAVFRATSPLRLNPVKAHTKKGSMT